MKLALQLAYKNLIGAGLKTWLNVGILAFTFLLIVFYNGFIDGWNRQAVNESIAWENGAGQLWNENYDPTDPFTILDGHGNLPESKSQGLMPVLVRQGTIYPDGRMVSALLKGLPIDQSVVKIPSEALASSKADFPILIGENFATSNRLKEGDEVLLRWRDKNGTFDASNVTIAKIFETDAQGVDNGQMWMSIEKLREISGLEGESSYFVAKEELRDAPPAGWTWHDNDELLAGLYNVIQSKKASGSIMYILLLGIALLAIFDTQVLSIFRRQKEIGTYISLGMTRLQVVKLFTVEGAMYSLMAAIVAFGIGLPLLSLTAVRGIPIPEASQSAGVSISAIVYPYYSLGLVVSTLILVIVSATIVSYLPARKIAKMDPVNALKGKIQ